MIANMSKQIHGETDMNRWAREYMAEYLDMHEVYEDQEQNFWLSHIATFGMMLWEAHVQPLEKEIATKDAEIARLTHRSASNVHDWDDPDDR